MICLIPRFSRPDIGTTGYFIGRVKVFCDVTGKQYTAGVMFARDMQVFAGNSTPSHEYNFREDLMIYNGRYVRNTYLKNTTTMVLVGLHKRSS